MSQGTRGGGCARPITHPRGLAASGRRGWGLGFVAAVLLGLNWVCLGHAAPGDLDPTFGSGGISIAFGSADAPTALLQQTDGKLVVAGRSSGIPYIFLARYRPDGHPDPWFGRGGKLTTAIGSRSRANALIQQPDGKLVVAGASFNDVLMVKDVLVVRYLPDGRLDATFGVGGAVTTDFGAGEEATALALQPDGKLVLAGWLSRGGLAQTTILARYLPDGRLDDTFGAGGKVTISPGGAVLPLLLCSCRPMARLS